MQSPTVAEVSGGRDNNFNLIRFIAASMVILHHSGLHVFNWLAEFTRGRENEGSVAVLLFFTISGFLVTRSFDRSSLKSFFIARALRIFPALWVAIPFTIIVASFASAVPWGRYLTHPQTLKYWLHNSFVWDLEYTLPGAFLHVPGARNVNGSLWTLPAELRMYWICAGVGLLGFYRNRPIFNLYLLAVGTLLFTVKPELLPTVSISDVAQWDFAFLLGAASYVNRDQVRLSIPLAAALFAATYLVDDPALLPVVLVIAIAYATMTLSLHPAVFFRPFTRLGDYSYGLYIFAFPLQQQAVFYFPSISPLARLGIVFPQILAVAVLSWHLVEKPALGLKNRLKPKPDAFTVEDGELAALAL